MGYISTPLKIQGKKTKLLDNIFSVVNENFNEYNIWIEPFLGSGIVALNVPSQFKHIICADINPHIISFYRGIQNGYITSEKVREFLKYHQEMFAKSEEGGYAHYRCVKDEFNKTKDIYLFLLLTRTSFNGIMRFNKKGEWNVPYCKVQNRLTDKLIDEICNNIDEIYNVIISRDYTFVNVPYELIIKQWKRRRAVIYADPPYLGLNVNYFDSWDLEREEKLYELLKDNNFILSTWLNNGKKDNDVVKKFGENFNIKEIPHKYFVAAKTDGRKNIVEGLIYNKNAQV